MASPSKQLISTLVATAEACGAVISQTTAALMLEDMANFHEPQILGALKKCRREVRGRLSLADILSRIDDGRPGPEEAWAMIPAYGDEETSVFQTQEMLSAMEHARHLEDDVARRMSFKETYIRLIGEAREAKIPVQWFPSMGTDKQGREDCVIDALEKGRISRHRAEAIIGPGRVLEALGGPSERPEAIPSEIRKLAKQMTINADEEKVH